MSAESRRTAAIIFLVLPSVMYGGVSILMLLIGTPEYMANQLRQDLWRAGHAHAGVFLILSLVALRYVDEATLSPPAKQAVRAALPAAAILIPFAFFFSVLDADATEPNALINVVYLGAGLLAAGVITLGVGLIRKPPLLPNS
jgi:drug/metabolite transporter superfamily protein YnfA